MLAVLSQFPVTSSSGACDPVKGLYIDGGCCPSSPSAEWTPDVPDVEAFKAGWTKDSTSGYTGKLCYSEKDVPFFDKTSSDALDAIAFWKHPEAGQAPHIGPQIRSLDGSKFNLKTTNCPAHIFAYGMITNQYPLTGIPGVTDDVACAPDLMAYSATIDESYDKEYLMNVRSSLQNYTSGVLSPSRLPCYMWQPVNRLPATNELLNCDGPTPFNLKTLDIMPTIHPSLTEAAFQAQLTAIVAGPSGTKYDLDMRAILLYGLGLQHLSFAFFEAYATFPDAFSSDTICVPWVGDAWPGVHNDTCQPQGVAYKVNTGPGQEVCITANPASRNSSQVVNTDLFSAAFMCAHSVMGMGLVMHTMPKVALAMYYGAEAAVFAGKPQANFKKEDFYDDVTGEYEVGIKGALCSGYPAGEEPAWCAPWH